MAMGKQTIIAVVIIIVLSFSLVTGVQICQAQSSLAITIKPDGSIEPITTLLERNGTTYTFKGDIEGTIWVQTDNIVIDGEGHSLIGNGTNTGKNEEIGILLGGPDLSYRRCQGVLIENLRIYNIPRGIYMVGGSNNSIIGNYLERSGMQIQGNANGTGDLVERNTILNNSIVFDYNPNGTDILTENNFVDSGVAVLLANPPIVDRNYWSDYTTNYPNALEIQGTGIGNTPYVFSTFQNGTQTIPCQDNHPLLNPVSISFSSVPTTQQPGEVITFLPLQQWAIPSLNSTINFGEGGSYREASFNWTFWHFSNLKIGNSSFAIENFDISVQNCNVTIQSYTKEFGNDNFLSRSTLNYTVAGGGNQTFYYTADTGGFWYAFVDGVEGGYLTTLTSSDHSITVTGSKASTSNVTIVNAVPPGPKPPPASPLVPEFPAWITLSLVLLAPTALALIFLRRRK